MALNKSIEFHSLTTYLAPLVGLPCPNSALRAHLPTQPPLKKYDPNRFCPELKCPLFICLCKSICVLVLITARFRSRFDCDAFVTDGMAFRLVSLSMHGTGPENRRLSASQVTGTRRIRSAGVSGWLE